MEPSTSSLAGVTFVIGTVSVVGTLFGMQYDSLLFGLFGGLIFLMNSPRTSRVAALSSIVASVLLAGIMAPILAALLLSWYEVLSSVGEDNIRRASALAIGAGWHATLPTAFSFIKSKLNPGDVNRD